MALSPLNRRRFERFKANRRGWWSLWLFLILFGLSLGAELIANDKPIAVRYDGEWYFPAFKRYPETTFGGEFPLEANYKSPYIRELLEKKDSFVLWALSRSATRASTTTCACPPLRRPRRTTGWAPTTRAATYWRG